MLLGLLPLFIVGRYFYQLAHEHNRSTWGFAILGIVVYFASQFLLGIVLGLVLLATGSQMILEESSLLLNLVGIGMGVLAVWLFYYLLKKNWEKNPKSAGNSDLLDQ